MKKMILFVIHLFTFSQICFGQNVWINEIHYENDGTDVGEFVEIALENADSYTLSNFRLSLYNGADSARTGVYHTLNTFVVGTTENNITLYFKNIAGIQNGDPDGLSLDYNGSLIQFLSYEGSFLATDGPADGQTSIDIGVSETSSTPAGESLQLNGTGTQYSDFIWFAADVETKGTSNSLQSLPVQLTSFTATLVGVGAMLNWTTATEVNNYGFDVERTSIPLSPQSQWEVITFIEGHGNSNSPKEYSFIDALVVSSPLSYRLKQLDTDGGFEYFPNVFGITVSVALAKTVLFQNHPNPFNPSTIIRYEIQDTRFVSLKVYNLLGENVATLVNNEQNAGSYEMTFNGSKLASGFYFYRFETVGYTQTMKMLLIK